jgi:hypothetical protein
VVGAVWDGALRTERFSTNENGFRYQASSCGVCGTQSGTWAVSSPSTSVSPVSGIPPVLTCHSFTCHQLFGRLWKLWNRFYLLIAQLNDFRLLREGHSPWTETVKRIELLLWHALCYAVSGPTQCQPSDSCVKEVLSVQIAVLCAVGKWSGRAIGCLTVYLIFLEDSVSEIGSDTIMRPLRCRGQRGKEAA